MKIISEMTYWAQISYESSKKQNWHGKWKVTVIQQSNGITDTYSHKHYINIKQKRKVCHMTIHIPERDSSAWGR